MSLRLFAFSLVGVLACSSASSPNLPPSAPRPLAAPESVGAATGPNAQASPLGDDERDALARQVEELATLGTGASLAVVVDGAVVPFVTGTVFPDGPPVTPTTRFGVASVSKLMTAAKIITIAHAGTIGLADSVASHLRGVRFVDEAGKDHADTITVEQLLMHRGGLPHGDPAFDPKSFGSTWQDPALLTKMTESWTLTLNNEPGTYGYSNLGYATLAAVIETIEGCSFAACMRRFLVDDLALESATMWPPSLERDDAGEADAAHGRALEEGQETFHSPAWYGTRIASPYTGLWISMPDLARFGTILIEASRNPDAPLHAMTTGVPAGEKGHGRGPVHSVRGALATMQHDGSGPGFLAYLITVPDRDLVVAIAVNGGGETKEGGTKLRDVTDAILAVLGVDR